MTTTPANNPTRIAFSGFPGSPYTCKMLALLDALLEDYADEWITKPMFHDRCAFEADVDRASRIVPLPMNIQASNDELAWVAMAFGGQQALGAANRSLSSQVLGLAAA